MSEQHINEKARKADIDQDYTNRILFLLDIDRVGETAPVVTNKSSKVKYKFLISNFSSL